MVCHCVVVDVDVRDDELSNHDFRSFIAFAPRVFLFYLDGNLIDTRLYVAGTRR